MQMPPTPGEMLPIIGMVAGIVCLVVVGLVVVKLAQSLLGQALARRISGRTGAGDQELREEVI